MREFVLKPMRVVPFFRRKLSLLNSTLVYRHIKMAVDFEALLDWLLAAVLISVTLIFDNLIILAKLKNDSIFFQLMVQDLKSVN